MSQSLRAVVGIVCVCVLGGGVAHAQTPAGPGQGGAATSVEAVASPKYVTIALQIDVERPAAEVWKRVGKYCDISEWFPGLTCTITSGEDGQVGAVRSVANEVLVGRTELSYTYTQPVTPGRPYNLYHGTLEARPVTPLTTSRLLYTLMYDNSMLADDAAREQDRQRRAATFTTALQNMKILAEGGTLPPQPARGRRGGAPGGAAPAGRGN